MSIGLYDFFGKILRLYCFCRLIGESEGYSLQMIHDIELC